MENLANVKAEEQVHISKATKMYIFTALQYIQLETSFGAYNVFETTP